MADAYIRASTEASVIVPKVWSQKYYDVLLAELPFNEIIDKNYEGEIQALGDTVKISTFPEFDDAVEFAEDARVDASALTITQASLVINKQVAKDFIVTNKASLQSLPMMDKLKEMAAYAINKKVQALIIADIVPNAAAPDHSIAYLSGTTLTLADILASKELLDAQNVPMANRNMVLGSAQMNDLLNINQLLSADYIAAGAPVQSGQIQTPVLGFAPKYTTVAGNTSYFFHPSFMTMAAQKGLAVSQYDLGVDGRRAARVNTDTLFGLKQLDGKRVVTIS